MSKHKFKIGDRVRINHNALKDFVPKEHIGAEGEIVGTTVLSFLVEVPGRSYPLIVARKAIDFIRSEKIIIYRNGSEVIAKNTLTGKTGVAKCNPADEFDFNTGAKLAFERLTAPEPEKPKYYSGKVVCTKSPIDDFKVGKVYEFIDGLTTDECGIHRPIGYRLTSLKDDKCFTNTCDFIPLIED